jgi:hypothetical protein
MDSFSPSAICASCLGGTTRAGDFKSSQQSLKNKIAPRFASVDFISYSFIGSDKKRIAKYKNDFFSPPLTCASCLGGN